MKEYIYLDNELVNSYLAQLDEGVLTKLITGIESTEASQEDGGEEITNATNGGIDVALAKGGHEYSKTEVDKFSTVFSKTNSELIETALDDYSLDVLLNKLDEKKLMSTDNWQDGEIVSFEGETAFYNFDQLNAVVNEDTIRLVVPKTDEVIALEAKINKLKKQKNKSEQLITQISQLEMELLELDGVSNFVNIERFANFMSVLFPDTILTKTNNTFALCARENIRVNIPTLSLYSLTKRNFKVIGIVVSKYEESLLPEDGDQLETDVIASKTPTIFMDIMLSSFEMIEIGDYFIRPIAIYYEKE